MLSSTLDLYFTNAQQKVGPIELSGKVKSDHLLIAGHRRTKHKIPQPQILRKRKWSKINWEQANFGVQASGVEQHVLACEDPDVGAERLHASVQSSLDYQQRVQNLQLRSKYCPWVNDNAKLVITDITLVTPKAMLQAPMSRTPLGVGFLINLHSFQASIFNDSKQFTRAKKEARG